jgi:hypothetical protein
LEGAGTVYSDRPQTWILLISASQIAKITDVSPRLPAGVIFKSSSELCKQKAENTLGKDHTVRVD